MNPSVSVIIPTFQRPMYLDQAIQSVLNQTYDKCEIIVVDDNGSGTDHQLETQKLIDGFGKNTRIRYIVQSENLGGSAARNVGIENSNGQYIAFLDDDDKWMPEFVQRHIDLLEKPEVDVVYCGYQRVHQDDKVIRSESVTNHRGMVFGKLLEGWCPTSTSLFMIKREVFNGEKKFDTRFPSFQDYDCWLSLAKDHQFDYCADPLLLKRGHGVGQISVNPESRRAGLAILESKWREKLSDSDWQVFQITLKRFEKEIRRKEFLIARQTEGFFASVPKVFRFLAFEIPTPKEIARAAKNMVFPYS